jgi:dethiobiotin synthetase
MEGLFITGSDTGVGKTLVTAAIARVLREQGRDVRVCKPVATGAEWCADHWRSDDTCRLAEAAGDDDLDAVTPWVLPVPAAPPVAARQAGIVLTLEGLAEAVRRRARAGKPVLVEGVGGLLCPLTDNETVADLAAVLGLPLLVVVRRSLGTLNHTLLTLEVTRGRRLRLAGVVVNETEPVSGVAQETNVDELRRRLDVPLLCVVPHQPGLRPAGLAGVDWWSLMGAERR